MSDFSHEGFQRRTVLAGGVLAGTAAMLPGGAIAATARPILKTIPASGERLPVIGLSLIHI